MSVPEQLIQQYARKLEVFDRPDIINVAQNNYRIISSNSQIQSMNIPGSCQAVLSLHLAGNKVGHKFVARKDLYKLAGWPKKQYQTAFNMIKDSTGDSERITIEEACVQLSCPHMREKASQLLNIYKNHIESALPQSRRDKVKWDSALYIAAAVAAVCKVGNVKIDKRKLLDISESSRKELDEHVDKMTEVNSTLSKTISRKRRSIALKEDDTFKETPNSSERLENKNSRKRKSSAVNEDESRNENADGSAPSRASIIARISRSQSASAGGFTSSLKEISNASRSPFMPVNVANSERYSLRLNEEEEEFNREEYEVWKASILKRAGLLKA